MSNTKNQRPGLRVVSGDSQVTREPQEPASIADDSATRVSEDLIIAEALQILQDRMRKPGPTMGSPAEAGQFLQLRLGNEERVVLCVLFLDTKNCLIAAENLFYGGIDSAEAPVSEIARRALMLRSPAVILAHNNPSGVAESSTADLALTKRAKEALRLLDIRVLDHIVVTGAQSLSMAAQGLI